MISWTNYFFTQLVNLLINYLEFVRWMIRRNSTEFDEYPRKICSRIDDIIRKSGVIRCSQHNDARNAGKRKAGNRPPNDDNDWRNRKFLLRH